MRNSASRLAATVVSLVVAVLLSGCGQTTKAPITGKVTVDDRPVRSGLLTFVGGSAGEKHLTVIGFDGRYTIDLPPGEYKVGVEAGDGQPGAAKMGNVPVPKAPKDIPSVMKDPTGHVGGTGVDMAKEMQNPVVVPMKYRSPESSGFAVTVTGRGDTYDIVMKSKG
jgi:hypothetical protein